MAIVPVIKHLRKLKQAANIESLRDKSNPKRVRDIRVVRRVLTPAICGLSLMVAVAALSNGFEPVISLISFALGLLGGDAAERSTINNRTILVQGDLVESSQQRAKVLEGEKAALEAEVGELREGAFLSSGQKIQGDRYQIVERLGQGGMGGVFLAVDNTLNRNVAIKVPLFDQIIAMLEQQCSGNREAVTKNLQRILQMFIDEGRQMIQLEHPAIVRAYNVEMLDLQAYQDLTGQRIPRDILPDDVKIPVLVMERIKGQDIDHAVRSHRVLLGDDNLLRPSRHGLPLSVICRTLRPVVSGLQEMQRKRIVHRDLKPGNVMLVADDQGYFRPKLIDFSIAKASGGNQITRAQTMFGEARGTPAYMDVVQMGGGIKRLMEAVFGSGAGNITWQVDLYGFGGTFYYMLTGRDPYDFPTAQAFNFIAKTNPYEQRSAVIDSEIETFRDEYAFKPLPRIRDVLYERHDPLVLDIETAVWNLIEPGQQTHNLEALKNELAATQSRLLNLIESLIEKTMSIDPGKKYKNLAALGDDLETIADLGQRYHDGLRKLLAAQPKVAPQTMIAQVPPGIRD